MQRRIRSALTAIRTGFLWPEDDQSEHAWRPALALTLLTVFSAVMQFTASDFCVSTVSIVCNS